MSLSHRGADVGGKIHDRAGLSHRGVDMDGQSYKCLKYEITSSLHITIGQSGQWLVRNILYSN